MTKRDFDVVYPEETLQEFEAGLGMTFSSKVYSERRTIGELFDDVWHEVAPLVTKGGRCPTAASFHHLKRAIQAQCPRQVITPSTVLTDIKGFKYIKLQAALRRTGWSSPFRHPRTSAGAYLDAWLPLIHAISGLWLGAVAVSYIGLGGLLGFLAMMAIFAGWFFALALLRQRYLQPDGLPSAETVGGLAQDMARLNLKRLRAEGATGLNRTIVWRMLFGNEPVDRSPIFIWDF